MNSILKLVLASNIPLMLQCMDQPHYSSHLKLIDTIRIDISIGASLDQLKELFQTEPTISKKIIELDDSEKSALDYAEEHDNDAVIDFLYTNLTQDQKNELLRGAAFRGNFYMAKKSIQKGAQIIHEARIPPFNLASERGHKDIIALFYVKEPDIKNKFNYGLAVAALQGHKELAVWLLNQGAQPGHIKPDKKSKYLGIVNHLSLMGLLLPQ